MLSIIIFGGTGDLARKKLFKSLYNLYSKNLLPKNTKIIGFARRDLNTDTYRSFVSDELSDELELKQEFLECFYYFQGDLHVEQSYYDLKTFLMELDEQYKVCASKLFYLSIRPELYADVFDLLKKTNVLYTCTTNDTAWSRLLIEKPFGTNFEHAKILDEQLATVVSEDRIFRIDHYLAKEVLENILVFRFKNKIFNTIWNKEYVSKITIKLFEKRDVKDRTEFYDQVGALRDVGQNHALQILALMLMQEPKEFTGEYIRNRREEVLSTLKPLQYTQDFFDRGQYELYSEHTQNIQTETETYFKIGLQSTQSHWEGVPFIIESGKSMQKDETTIQVDFVDGNTMYFEIQPVPRIALSFNVKESGYDYKTIIKDFSFSYQDNDIVILDAYEKILYQAIAGDVTSFVSTKEVLDQWKIIDEILNNWKKIPLRKY
jgi:glucose-6-phosphate 1-dehydrogenase